MYCMYVNMKDYFLEKKKGNFYRSFHYASFDSEHYCAMECSATHQ